MIKPEFFLSELQRRGIDFYTGVPDSLLKNFLVVLEEKTSAENHIIAANEGNAVAIASGYYLGTKKPALVYMQNSGLGNAINPLTSLTHPDVYSLPMILLIGWRGEPNTKDEPQHMVMGAATVQMLQTMQIPYAVMSEKSEEALALLDHAVKTATDNSAPFAILCGKGIFEEAPSSLKSVVNLISRDSAIEQILATETSNDVYICTTGFLGRAVLAQRQKLGTSGDQDFLNAGAMGHASQIALGLALSNRDKQIICLDGDGALIMHMGALCTIGKNKVANFKHIVFNNGVHDSVGGQSTAGLNIDIVAIAKACGYLSATRCETEESLNLLPDFRRTEGPALLELRITPGASSDLPRPLRSFKESKTNFINLATRSHG